MNLTTGQKTAINLKNQSGIINANAGAGKTFVLIERILHLITNENISLNNILAITFTEKAAAELKERLTNKITNPQQKQLVENSYISTIHSFCARILREHCFEAGLNPRFKILGNSTEAEVLLEESAAKTIDRLIANDNSEIVTILNIYQLEKFIESSCNLLGRLRGAGLDIEDLEKLLLTEEYWKKLPTKIKQIEKLIFEDLKKSALDLNHFEFAGTVGQWLENFINFFKSTPTDNCFEKLETIIKDKPRKNKEITNEEEYELFKKTFDSFKKEYKKGLELISIDIENEKEYQQLYNSILIIIKEIYINYQTVKEKESLLDFEDLQLKAKKLLTENKKIRDYYQTKFQQIMLDEFQDTDLLQKEIFDLISSEKNLFIVGDWKQSIYRFRNADVHIFIDTIDKFIKLGQQNIPLQENFRSAKPVIDFANFICAQVWDNDKPKYDKLIYAADSAGKTFKKPQITINLISNELDSDLKKNDKQQLEASKIAQEIQKLIKNGRKYNEITVLLKTFSALDTYENTLAKYNIPFITFGGRYYYQREEIVDLINFLKVIDNPLKETTLAGVLRSPFVGIRDESLLILASQKKNQQTLIDVLNKENIKQSAIIAHDKIKILHFINLYEFLANNCGKMTITKTLTELVNQSNYILNLLTLKNGEKKAGNINKLIELSRNFDNKPNISLRYFVKFLEKMQQKEAREEEAVTISNKEPLVKIMTVHKSKGLEFPIVFLPDINRRSGGRASESLNFELNIYHKYYLPCGLKYTEASGEQHKNHVYKIQDYFNKKEDILESKRLFYVALTRAEEKLYISSILDSEKISPNIFNSSGNWGQWLSYIYHNNKSNLENIGQVNIISGEPENIYVPKETTDKSFVSSLQNKHQILLAKKQKNLKYSKLTTTELIDLQKDPKLFLDKYYFAFEQLIEKPSQHKSMFNKEVSEKIGNTVHELIQSNQTNFADIIDQKQVFSLRERKYILKCLENYFNSDLYQIITNQNQHYFELPFDILVNNLQIDGRIDLAYKEQNTWHIVDFKTNQQTPKNLKEYQQQLSIYGIALSRLYSINITEIKLKIYYLYDNELVDIEPIPDIISRPIFEELL